MKTQELQREALVWIGSLLEYPKEQHHAALPTVALEIALQYDNVAKCLKDFFAEINAMSFEARQEHYVRTFDVFPVSSLYLSVHLFGEESFKRSELMTGFKAVYDQHPEVVMTELPDHLGVVLTHNEWFKEEEWQELVTMCLLPALPKMMQRLEKGKNPYALLLKATQMILMEKEMNHV